MISSEYAISAALSFEGAEEKPHFEKLSFRIKDKIFATLDTTLNQMVVKLKPEEQYAFSVFDNTAIYPVPGGWGKKGWTILELARVRQDMFTDALRTAYMNTAPKNLAEKYRKD